MLNTRFSPWPHFTDEDVEAVSGVLRSGRVNYWTGEKCRTFEREFAAACGTRHAVALMNGTVAIDLALEALGIGPGDDVIVTPRTFIASVSSVVNAGARPVFADVDRDSGNMSADTIAAVLTDATKAIVCVHLAGWPCDMDPIMNLAAERGFAVIEDCAQAHGALYRGRPVGSIGSVGAWSFCQDKIITTGGEGGMVTTDDDALFERMWAFKDHGKSFDAVYRRSHPPGFRWLHESFGTNWRMLEMQAAIGSLQLAQLEKWATARGRAADRYRATCERYPGALRSPTPGNSARHAYYRFYAYVRPEGLKPGWTRDRIVERANELGMPLYQGSCSEVYLEKAFDDTGLRPAERLPVARELGETSLMFLTHPTLTSAELEEICGIFDDVMREAAL